MHIKVKGEYKREEEWIPMEAVVSSNKVYIEQIGFNDKGCWANLGKPNGKLIVLRIAPKEYKRLSKLLLNSPEEVAGRESPIIEETEKHEPIQNPLEGMDLGTN